MKRQMIGIVLRVAVILCILAMAGVANVFGQTSTTFKVATLNIRSGQGEQGILATKPFTSTTNNCTDPTLPMNGWGINYVQPVIVSAVRDDPKVVFFGVNEGWGCGGKANVAALFNVGQAGGWKSISAENNGDFAVARYGLVGTWEVIQVNPLRQVGNEDQEPRFVTGGQVCLDAACSKTVWMYVTHLGEPFAQVDTVNTALAVKPNPKILVGDFNMWTRDQWSPLVKCNGFPEPEGEARLEKAYFKMRGAGWLDAWPVTHLGEGNTGMVARDGCGSPNASLFKRIDFTFSKVLDVVSSERFGMPAGPGAPGISDHVGLITEYRLPAATTPSEPPSPGGGGGTVTDPGTAKPEIVKWASGATVTGAWAIQADTTAAGGQRLANTTTTNPKVNAPVAGPASYAELTFWADAGVNYHLWLRLKAPGNVYDNDSVWVQFSDSVNATGGAIWRIGSTDGTSVNLEEDSNAGVSGWGWQDNGYGTGVMGQDVRFATTGTHTIRFQPRDDGVQIDQIVLSSGTYRTQSPGALKNDTVILQEK